MSNKWISIAIILAFFLVGLFMLTRADQEGREKTDLVSSFMQPETSIDGFGVSAGHPLAVEVGMDILEKGGNAVDAAIAVSYVLAVVEPFGSGLGGGGAMVIVPGKSEDGAVFYDYREIAPLNGAFQEPYIGVPGFVKGMEEVHKEHGLLPLETLLQPALEFAENGFEVNTILTERLQAASGRLSVKDLPHFFPNGTAIRPGQHLVQKELAETIKVIQEEGAASFYEGELAEQIVNQITGIELEDVQGYRVSRSKPVEGTIKGHTIYSAPPPLAGLTVIQMVQMSEIMAIENAKDDLSNFIHLVGEISKLADQSRMEHIGDMNFTNVPINELQSVEYAKDLSSKILFNQLSKQQVNDPTPADELDHSDTTHFVIYDEEGTMVSATHSLSNFFGSGVYAAGIFFNNQLMNFSHNPSSPNYIEAGKRPRSFMAPTIIVKEGKPVLGIGSPGGRRIPSVITQVLIRNVFYDTPLQDAIEAPRFHIEDDTVYLEDEVPNDVKQELINRGYHVTVRESPVFFGGVQALEVDRKNNILSGGSDTRRIGVWETK